MTKNSDFDYWIPRDKQRLSFAFAQHTLLTAQSTGRPHFALDHLNKDKFGRVHWAEFESAVNKSNFDPSYTFDCAAGIGGVHLQQVGAMVNASPTLNDGIDILISCMSYFDDRLISFKAESGNLTTFTMFYNEPMDADFYHIQCAAIFMELIDAWPRAYIDNSTFNFPRISKQQRTTTKAVFSKYPWVAIEFDKFPAMSWTIETEKLNWPAPNFNPNWYEHCQKFLRWGLDSLSVSEEYRKAWSRFSTASMLCDLRNLNLNRACKIAGVSNKTLSKKIAGEGYNAAALKTWILKEWAHRAVGADLPENVYANMFGFTVSEARATLKRRNVENPYLLCHQSKAALKDKYGLDDRQYSDLEILLRKPKSVA